MRRLLVILSLIALPASLTAQRMGVGHFPGPSPGLRTSGFNHAGYARPAYYPLPLFEPFYSNYEFGDGYPAPPQPPVIVMQSPPVVSEPSQPPAQPLVIELQGDRYVQVSGDQASSAQLIDRMPARQPTVHTAAPSSSQLPRTPTVLVFRDGHHEEVSDYTIADGVLYAASDYYTSGAWNHKIALASLNLPETIASNHAHGVLFHVPSSSNEVIVGP